MLSGLSLKRFSELSLCGGDCRGVFPGEAEVCAILPHTVQNNADPAGERHGGTFLSPPLGDGQRPCGQPVLAAAVQHDRRRLVKRRAQSDISGPRYLTNDVALTRLLAPRRQPDLWADVLGRSEPLRVINGRLDGQRNESADPGHRHERATDRVLLGVIAQSLLQAYQFLSQSLS